MSYHGHEIISICLPRPIRPIYKEGMAVASSTSRLDFNPKLKTIILLVGKIKTQLNEIDFSEEIPENIVAALLLGGGGGGGGGGGHVPRLPSGDRSGLPRLCQKPGYSPGGS